VGGHRARAARAGVDAIRYLVKEGIQWRAMPADFPPWSPVYDCLAGWQASGATAAIHDELREQCRVAVAATLNRPPRSSTPSRSRPPVGQGRQSVKAAETVARSSRGFDAGKKIGHKRQPK
jgi:transposase